VGQPAVGIGIVGAHHRLRGGIGAELRELAEDAELREARPRAEQAEAVYDMALQRGKDRAGTSLDQRKVLRRAADQRHPPDLAGAEHFGEFLALLQPAALGRIEGQPAAHLHLVDLLQPAIAEHRLGQPFVGEVFEQVGDEGLGPIRRHDAALGMARFEVIDQRGGIVGEAAVGIFQHRDHRRLHRPQRRLPPRGFVDPDVGQPPIAQQRADLLRIGRAQGAIECVGHAVPRALVLLRAASPGLYRANGGDRSKP